MMALTLLVLYSVAVFAASVVGGWLPRRFHMTHTRTQLTMSFVAGLMLGVAFFHLIPHSALGDDANLDFAMGWVVAGLVFMLMLLRLFHFHQHDFAEHGDGCDHDHEPHDHAVHRHAGGAEHKHMDTFQADLLLAEPNPPGRSFSWIGLLLGLSIHTLVDGIALGAVMRAESAEGAGILGIGVFLAILLHKPLDSLSIETVMAASGHALAMRRWVNLLFAALCPLAAILFWFLVDGSQGSGLLLPAALAFSAGAFVCIALGDLLPEIQFHSHDRLKLTLLFVLGIGLAWMIGALEPAHNAGFYS